MSRGAWHPSLTTWVDRVDARWHHLGLPMSQRRELRIELVTDLSQARLEGAPLEELLAVDADRFATDVAVAHGFHVPASHAAGPPDSSSSDSETSLRRDSRDLAVARVAIAGLLGAVVGGIVSLIVLLPLVGWVDHHERDASAGQVAAMLAVYVAAALVAALCGGLAVSSACADSPSARLLGRRAAMGLIISGVVATLVTVCYANATDYSTERTVVLYEVGLVIGICLIGLVLVARSTKSLRSSVASRAR